MTTEQDRLKELMQKEEMNAKDFATEVGISAATMSNILSGRNKPSLEVMQKVLGRFRMVSPEWLILGVGTMYKLKVNATEQTLFDIKPEIPTSPAPENQENVLDSPVPAISPAARPQDGRQKATVQIIERPVSKKVSKVVVFFDDGTFQEL